MIKAYFDGACYPINPNGTMGVGAVVYGADGAVLFEHSETIAAAEGNTNNVAEYMAVIKLLDWVKENPQKQGVTLHGDSRLVVMQLAGHWRIKNGSYVPLAQTARKLLRECQTLCPVNVKWVRREDNQKADDLSKGKTGNNE